MTRTLVFIALLSLLARGPVRVGCCCTAGVAAESLVDSAPSSCCCGQPEPDNDEPVVPTCRCGHDPIAECGPERVRTVDWRSIAPVGEAALDLPDAVATFDDPSAPWMDRPPPLRSRLCIWLT